MMLFARRMARQLFCTNKEGLTRVKEIEDVTRP